MLGKISCFQHDCQIIGIPDTSDFYDGFLRLSSGHFCQIVCGGHLFKTYDFRRWFAADLSALVCKVQGLILEGTRISALPQRCLSPES